MKKTIIPLMSAAMLLGISSCSNVDEPAMIQQQEGRITDPQAIKDYLSRLVKPGEGGPATRAAIGSPTEGLSTEQIPGVENGVPGYWVINKKHYKASHAWDETIVLDPKAEILYPGCVLRGKSIEDGTYAPITDAEVGEITFSISQVLEKGEDPTAIRHTLFNPRMSDYRTVFNEWARLNFKKGAVTSMQSLETVTSEKEAMAKLGATFKSEQVDVGANLGFDFNRNENHILAKFIQKQYTVTTDFPRTPTIFTAVNPYILENYQPVYVSNITYGRMVLMTIDTKHSVDEVRAALNFAVKAIDLNIELEQQYRKVLDDSKVHVTIIGGNHTSQAMPLIDGLVGFKEFMKVDPQVQDLTPISFSLRYAADNAICKVMNNNEYDVVSKTFVPEFKEMRIEIALSGLKGTEGNRLREVGKEFEMYGTAWASYNGNKLNDIFNIGRHNYYNVAKGTNFTAIDGQRAEVIIKKPASENFADFMNSRVRIYTHMRDYDARIIAKNDKDYSETYQEYSISDLLAKYKGGEPHFVVSSYGRGVKVDTQFTISNIYFK